MRKEFVTAGFVLFSFILPIKAFAASFSQIYVFGDSLSDTGNTFQATRRIVPPSPPYSQGRFSNGPLWVEYLATGLGLTPNRQTNFAYGGATTGSDSVVILGNLLDLPGLNQQINSFTTANPSADQNGLYIVWAGANDYLYGGVTNPSVPVTNLANAVTSLATVGAKNIMVVNLPDLGMLPGTRGNSQTSTRYSDLTAFHNSSLSATLKDLSSQRGINIIPFDVNSLFNQVIATPTEFGFTNVTNSCFNLRPLSRCTNPNEYLFWDNFHPTTRTHNLIAESALSVLQPVSVLKPAASSFTNESLFQDNFQPTITTDDLMVNIALTTVNSQSVPEPSVVLHLLALSALGVTGMIKRKQ